MKVDNIIDYPVKSCRCTLDDEAFNGYFIEVQDDGIMTSAYLCEDEWPRHKEFVACEYSSVMDFDTFIKSLSEPITESYLRFVFKRLKTPKNIPS